MINHGIRQVPISILLINKFHALGEHIDIVKKNKFIILIQSRGVLIM